MKVLVLANFGLGLYNFRKELLEKLIEQNNDVYVSLPNDEYVPRLEKIGCKFIDSPVCRRGTNPINDIKLLLHYKKIVKRIKPDVVLTFTIKPNVYGGIACRINGVPYITNITGLGIAVENGGLLQKISLFLYKVALKKAKCVFFQNKQNRDFFIEKGILNGKHKIIPGSGVNLNYYRLLDYPTDDVINFLFIARVMKEKGIEQYLEAAEYIKKRYPNTKFHILGYLEQDYEDILMEMQKKGIIKYHGMQTDVREFHKFSHCTIHPTFYPEGMSNVLLETAACGRPIITTNRSGCREIVDHGVNGYIVEQQNTLDLIEKIKDFLRLDYEAKKLMGIYGRMKVEKEFDRRIVIKQYLEEIKNLNARME